MPAIYNNAALIYIYRDISWPIVDFNIISKINDENWAVGRYFTGVILGY